MQIRSLPADFPNPQDYPLKMIRHVAKIFQCIRDAVGDDLEIGIGTHGQFSTAGAIRVARILEEFDPFWFEEPVPPENIDEMARVAAHTSIPIATGERLVTKFEFAELLRKQAAQIIQLDVGQCGGILESKKIAAIAEAHYAMIAPHMYCGPVAAAAAVQLDTCSPNFLIQEYNGGGLHQGAIQRTDPIRKRIHCSAYGSGAGDRAGRSSGQETVIDKKESRGNFINGQVGRTSGFGHRRGTRARRGPGSTGLLRKGRRLQYATYFLQMSSTEQLVSGFGRQAGRRSAPRPMFHRKSRSGNWLSARSTSFGTIDILANVVGIAGPTKDVWQMSLAEWQETLAVNLDSAFLGCKYVLPEMIRKRYGRIINFSSGSGKQPLSHRTPYTTFEDGHSRIYAHTGGGCRQVQHHGQRHMPRFP